MALFFLDGLAYVAYCVFNFTIQRFLLCSYSFSHFVSHLPDDRGNNPIWNYEQEASQVEVFL